MTMEKLNKCRICLAENVRMNVVANKNLQEIYEKLTDIPFVTEDRRPMLACFFCYSKLKQCYQLQRKCVEAEKMFTQMLNDDYETKPLINQGLLEFRSGSHKSIVDGFQTERLALNEELPAVCGLHDITEPKEECQSDELEPENFDNRYLDVADIPPYHSESDLDDDVPLKEIKIEVEEEHEVFKNNQRARESTSTITRGDDGVCERLDVFIEPKEEPQSDELEPENYDNSFLDVADLPPHHSESDLDDDIPLTEFKSEVDEEQEVSTRAAVATKPELEDTMTVEQTKEGKSDSKVKRTIIKKQIGETRYKCDVCQSSFSKTSGLIKHKRIHTGEKPFKCELCQRSFIERSALTNHSRVHTGEKPFKCHICQCSFRQTGALKTHIRQHFGEKAFKCHLCQRSFSQKSVLANHIRVHTGEKPFKCNICQCSFRQSSHLTTHIRQHTGEKPYKCDICQRSFTQKWDLTKHNRIHTGEKPYKCDSCERSFAQKSALTKHIRIHTGEKPYMCDVCQRSFRDKRALTKHIC